MKKVNKILDLKVGIRANKGRGVISVPRKYIGKRVKVIIYYNGFSKLHMRR